MSEEQPLKSVIEVLERLVGEGTLNPLPESLRGDERLPSILASLAAIQEFAQALSKGDLSRELKVRGFLAGSLKSLHANLRHLAWQTGRIAKGDFSQRVDFMGEFSEAFNSMVVSLAEARDRLLEHEQELVRLATTDVLTGIYNRRHFFDVAGHQIEQARRYDRPLAVIMFDIDHFKSVNDTYGHAAGDEVLRHIARMARVSLRKTDILARYGGEEFIVLMPETTPEAALFVSERTRELIAASQVEFGGQLIRATVSLGISSVGKAELESIGTEKVGLEQLINQADKALYESKETGRNRSTVYSKSQ